MPKSEYGPWVIQETIGEGGAGHVFRVCHKTSGQIGALKRLKNLNRKDRFRTEVEAVQKLKHPGIVQLLDFDLEDEKPFAVYEYEPGGSLGDIPPDKLLLLPLNQRLIICEQICQALQAAHNAGIVHRDVKPDNILISPDRTTARLCDFGLVFIDEGERQTATMEQVGSRFYIPPELEEGRASEVTYASDIYSVGKVIYYLISGQMFSRERHRESKYNLASILSNPYLELISRLLDRCVIANPDQRLESAEKLATLLGRARTAIREQHPVAGVDSTYRCLFCRTGTYKVIATSFDQGNAHNNGYPKEGNIGSEQFVFVECSNCGNAQRFKYRYAGKLWFPSVTPPGY
jgi:serine/threonine protein kinase